MVWQVYGADDFDQILKPNVNYDIGADCQFIIMHSSFNSSSPMRNGHWGVKTDSRVSSGIYIFIILPSLRVYERQSLNSWFTKIDDLVGCKDAKACK